MVFMLKEGLELDRAIKITDLVSDNPLQGQSALDQLIESLKVENQVTVTSPDATDLATAITLVNEIKAQLTT